MEPSSPISPQTAWIYTRKSRALGDAEEPELLAAHLSFLARRAAADGVSVAPERVLAEVGSGEEIERRPVFRRLLEAWERLPRGAGGILYVTDIDRLSRGEIGDQARIAQALARAAIQVRTPTRQYDLNGPDGSFFFGLEALFAQRELQAAKRRLKRGQEEKRRQGGLPNGTAPFGYVYHAQAQTLAPHPQRFDILRRCCREALTFSVRSLAARYGVPATCLLRALRNPTLCGWPARHYGPRDPEHPHRKSYVPVPRSLWEWPERANDTYPHACSREEWEQLQLALDARREQRARNNRLDGWCRDVLTFAASPGPVRLGGLVTSQRKSGNVCLPVYERRAPREPYLYVARATVHAAAEAALRHVFTHPHELVHALEQYRERHAAANAAEDQEAETQRLQLALALARRRYQEAVDAEMDAESEPHRQALATRRRRLEESLPLLHAELQAALARAPDPPALAGLAGDLPALARGSFDAAWQSLVPQDRRELVNVTVGRMVVSIEPEPPPRPFRRTVSRVEYCSWLRSYFVD